MSWQAPSLSPQDEAVWRRPRSRQAQEQLDKKLRVAIAAGYDGLVRFLLIEGANIDAQDPKTGWVRLLFNNLFFMIVTKQSELVDPLSPICLPAIHE